MLHGVRIHGHETISEISSCLSGREVGGTEIRRRDDGSVLVGRHHVTLAIILDHGQVDSRYCRLHR